MTYRPVRKKNKQSILINKRRQYEKNLIYHVILALAACGDDDDAVATPPAEPTPAPHNADDDGEFVWSVENPYVSFTMEENASTQKDLLVAKHANISYNEAKAVGKAKTGLNDVAIVSQTFDHA